jgi:prenyltransferase beta subunit
VLGNTRRSYLTTFILNNEIEGVGFSNAIESDNTISFEATAYALNILNFYRIDPQDIDSLKDNLEDKILDMFDNNEVNLYDLYYLLKSLNYLDYIIDTDLSNRIYDFLNQTEQITGGFSFSNTSKSANMASTFYAIQIYPLINSSVPSVQNHKNWILSCYNSDGGYGGNQSLTSTLINTCFAVFLIDELGEIEDLVGIFQTFIYLQSHYVLDLADLLNNGGYLPDEFAQFALLSSTYYSVRAVSLINYDKLIKGHIRSWVLEHQNFKDGGFTENTQGYQQKESSLIASYYAFETLRILDSLSYLSSEIWMVEFDYWILGIVLGSIGLAVVLIFFLWKRRRI